MGRTDDGVQRIVRQSVAGGGFIIVMRFTAHGAPVATDEAFIVPGFAAAPLPGRMYYLTRRKSLQESPSRWKKKPSRSRKSGPASAQPSSFALRLPALIASCPALAPFVKPNAWGDVSVDFADPAAVKMLNRALLQHFYGIEHWDIPADYLCPPIPGRADYLHHLADLLATSNGGEIPRGKGVAILDVGVGANCIYPIVGLREYGWRFTGSEIDPCRSTRPR